MGRFWKETIRRHRAPRRQTCARRWVALHVRMGTYNRHRESPGERGRSSVLDQRQQGSAAPLLCSCAAPPPCVARSSGPQSPTTQKKKKKKDVRRQSSCATPCVLPDANARWTRLAPSPPPSLCSRRRVSDAPSRRCGGSHSRYIAIYCTVLYSPCRPPRGPPPPESKSADDMCGPPNERRGWRHAVGGPGCRFCTPRSIGLQAGGEPR